MSLTPAHARHERHFEANRYVYPVISRRSHGLSIGVNLNPDKICNFDCIYCQVNRSVPGETRFVDLDGLLTELDAMLELAVSGRLYQSERFRDVPAPLRRLNDIAFSGDGEPTTYRNFDEIMSACADLKRRRGQDRVKMVLITNASMFHRPAVRRGLEIMDRNNGEIWAKLEAGTEAYFRLVDRATIPFARILDNITQAAKIRPLVIQSLFMRIHDQPPPQDELAAFCRRLRDILSAGGKVKLVQVYTVARRPAETFVTPLQDGEVDAIADLIRRETGLTVEPFYGGTG
jgi:wyosine [tRNA(Phe)-imidazoG37] synthetase (radical SAM superfamily)